ncbi:hypothetical protein Pfo_027199, partial [Paulownia fortunei]
ILFQAMAIEQKKGCFLTRKYTVHVMNHLPLWSNIPLRLHCASGDNDLGYHKLPIFGDFNWTFCDNIFGTTLYFCHLWWNSRLGPKQKAFNVFTEKWSPKCTSGVCYWAANQDGIHFTGSNPPMN